MTLEERYNAAANDTYVGRVKNLQAADAGAGRGVNFMDGEGASTWTVGKPPAVDQVQTEFTRNKEGAFRYGGDGKIAGSYILSRWLNRGVEKGDAYMQNNAFTTLVKGDVRNSIGTVVYKYSPLIGKSFFESLPDGFAKNRANPKSAGYSAPYPSGLQG